MQAEQSNLPACARADVFGSVLYALGLSTALMQSAGLGALYNPNFVYLNKSDVKTTDNVKYETTKNGVYNSNPSDNNPDWRRIGIENDLSAQRFNIWDVSMSLGSREITLTSKAPFSNYRLLQTQCQTGLILSFIPTYDGAGYNSGQYYTIHIDDLTYKLFEHEDESLPSAVSNIKANKLVSIYFNENGDGGNGAFYLIKNSGDNGNSAGRKVGEIFWSPHEIYISPNTLPPVTKANGSKIYLQSYIDYSAWLIRLKQTNPKMFTSTEQEWHDIKNSTAFGQVNKYYFQNNILYAWLLNGNDFYTQTLISLQQGQIDIYDENNTFLFKRFANSYGIWDSYNNYTKTGTLTLEPNINGFEVSGFSTTNQLTQTKILDTNRPWEAVMSFSLSSSSANQTIFNANNNGISIGIGNTDGQLDCTFSSNGLTVDIGTISVNVNIDTRYYIKCSWDGSVYSASISTDGATYTVIGTINSTTACYKPITSLYSYGSYNDNNYLNGIFYLDNTYIIKYLDDDSIDDNFIKYTRDETHDITDNESYVLLPAIKYIAGIIDADNHTPTIQKQEVPTGTFVASSSVYGSNTGAFVKNTEQVSGYNAETDGTQATNPRKYTYDPQLAGDNTFATNGKNVETEAVEGYFYIQLLAPTAETPTTYPFVDAVQTINDLPVADENNKGCIYLVQDATNGGFYISNGYNWLKFEETGTLINIANLANKVNVLEQNAKIYSNYTTAPYYEVYANGMCKQWDFDPTASSGTTFTMNKTFTFTIPYIDTAYQLLGVGFNVAYAGRQGVTKRTTGFTTASQHANCGTDGWMSYGMVDLEQISN